MIAGCGQPEQNQPEAVVPLRGGAVRGSERWGECFTSGSPLSGAITSGYGSVEGTPVRIARPLHAQRPTVLSESPTVRRLVRMCLDATASVQQSNAE